MILEPGTFRVSDYRKAIPDLVKVVAAVRAAIKESQETASVLDCADADFVGWVRNLQFDHRPPLCDRPYDTVVNDFVPPQNDPEHIVAVAKDEHLERTTGRKAGAEKTVTTRGSDVGERARTQAIKDTQAFHKAIMASKSGDHVGAAAILANTKPKKLKKKLAGRPFPQQLRGFGARYAPKS